MLRDAPLVEGEYYHIFNRGADKRVIFKSEHDFRRFVMLLHVCNDSGSTVRLDNLINRNDMSYEEILSLENKKPLVSVGAWCVMSNHFHLILRQEQKNGISKFMQKVGTGYSMNFNKKYHRSGTVFQGKFKSKHIEADDQYMKCLLGYIHLNPLDIEFSGWKKSMRGISKTKLKAFLEKYPYFSYPEYLGMKRPESALLGLKAFPKYFDKVENFKQFFDLYVRNKEGIILIT